MKILPHRLARSYPEHTRSFDQDEIGARGTDAAGEPDHENTGTPGDAAQAFLEDLAAHRIEHDVSAATIGDALHGLTEGFSTIEHRVIRTSLLRNGKLLLARSRGDDGRTQHLAEFDSGKPYAAACTVHEQNFTWLDLRAIDQRVIRRAMCSEKGRALRVIERRRQRHELIRRDDNLVPHNNRNAP